MQYKFIRLPEVKQRTGLPKSTIYRKISESTFPRQIPVGAKTVVWLESDINKWMEEQISKAANENIKPDIYQDGGNNDQTKMQ